jgi:hypothetical protein
MAYLWIWALTRREKEAEHYLCWQPLKRQMW